MKMLFNNCNGFLLQESLLALIVALFHQRNPLPTHQLQHGAETETHIKTGTIALGRWINSKKQKGIMQDLNLKSLTLIN
jgi:hypothetical protein